MLRLAVASFAAQPVVAPMVVPQMQSGDSAKIDPSFRTSIESRNSLADLVEYLQVVPDAVTQALATAIPKEG